MNLIFSVLQINFRHLKSRPGNIFVAFLGLGGIIFVLAVLFSIAQGLSDLANKDINPLQVIVLRNGAPSETMSEISLDELERVRTNLQEARIGSRLSAEAAVPVDVHDRDGGQIGTIVLRGLREPAKRLGNFNLRNGRWFAPGSNEIVIGVNALKQFSDFEMGNEVVWGRQHWVVVGILDTHGSMADGEAWADLDVLQSSYSRGSSVQSIYFDYLGTVDMKNIKKVVNEGAHSDLEVQTTKSYFAGQVSFLQKYIHIGNISLSLYLTFCVLLGTASIMDSILEPRMRNYNIINSMGYSKIIIFFSVFLEGSIMGLFGGLLGIILEYSIFDTVQISTTAAASQVEFFLHFTWGSFFILMLLSILIGAVGALIAIRGLWKRSVGINAIIS